MIKIFLFVTLGIILLAFLLEYIVFLINILGLKSFSRNSWMLPLTIRYKGKEIKVECKTTRIEIPNWDYHDGCAAVESNIFYFNEVPAFCIICPILGTPKAYMRNGYDNQGIYPILRKIKKTYNKNFSKEWKEKQVRVKKFY